MKANDTSDTAAAMLRQAAEAVSGERARTHGEKTINHENIARLWEAYVDSRLRQQIAIVLETRRSEPLIRAVDVVNMLVLLKIARTQAGEPNPDDYIDAAGYAACAYEIAGFGNDAVPAAKPPKRGKK